ncbi:enoyl-CoA hydratase/isomerase family protein [Arthrobacter sp. NyZ413]|uniref:enoyl-CoA hydratase/isomerase family protein n=1 Tax=Arthrobacter sp. NyZ413 TaxID=3144669 RepID=UPI003BF7B855
MIEGISAAPDLVLESHEGSVWTVGLNRPAKVNALTKDLLESIVVALDELTKLGARAIVLHGCGRAFSAGGDVRAIQAMSTDAEREDYLRCYARVGDAIAAAPFPVIAALHGAVYGGGLELACVADFRVVDIDAKLCAADIAIGLIPSGGLTWRLPRLIGPGRASWMLFTNAVLDGATSVQLGLCDVLSAQEDALGTALQLARSASQFAGHALASTKQALRQAEEGPLAASVAFEIEANVLGLRRPDVVATLQAKFPPKQASGQS